ncbi:hypothetical protein BKA70DRAFT_1468498 [Coprinopsis sp. MPI-PUGE-AT-0042]|nr:hypothetical protein BKA70DRAFT_1468498 [Coprinopsis sp. MPI-PUGE-AT-0042]
MNVHNKEQGALGTPSLRSYKAEDADASASTSTIIIIIIYGLTFFIPVALVLYMVSATSKRRVIKAETAYLCRYQRCGTIFDISRKDDVYGKGGSYHVFEGKDGLRGLGDVESEA